MKKCEHIYGYDEGYGYGDEGELPYLSRSKGNYDVQFIYCPLCGVKLEDTKAKSGKKEKG